MHSEKQKHKKHRTQDQIRLDTTREHADLLNNILIILLWLKYRRREPPRRRRRNNLYVRTQTKSSELIAQFL